MQSFPSSRKGQLLGVSAVSAGSLWYFIREALGKWLPDISGGFLGCGHSAMRPEISHDRLSTLEKLLQSFNHCVSAKGATSWLTFHCCSR